MSSVYTHRMAVESWKHFAIDQSGYISDENPYSNRALLMKLQEHRATFIKTALERGKELSEFMIQTLACVDMEEMDRNECPCAPASGCYWLKSKCELPKAIKLRSVTGIVASGSNPRFNEIKWDRFQYIPKARNTAMKNGRYYTVRDTGNGPYLYLYGDRFLETVSISGFFEDPIAAASFSSCGEPNLEAFCNPLDVDMYTDPWVRDIILPSMWQQLLPVRAGAGRDVINDDLHGNPVNMQ